MITILFLIVVALAAMVTAVAATARPVICCPAAGLASGTLLIVGAELAVGKDMLAAGLAATTCGLVAGGWGLTLALQDARRREAAEREAAERPRPVPPTAVRHDLDGYGHTITVETLAGGRAIVERTDGRPGKICATEADLDGVSIIAAARSYAETYGARYVPAGLHPDSSRAVLNDIAIEGILGGGR